MSIQTNVKINDLQGKKILVIDDDPDLCQLVAGTFAKTGAQVFAAASGYEGLRQFFEHRPDLVFIDIMMPKMDGWEVCRRIRQFAEIPLIILSALENENDVARGLDCGAIDFVTKPFSPKVLRARAQSALRQVTPPTAAKKPA